jgi:hypothetical protein
MAKDAPKPYSVAAVPMICEVVMSPSLLAVLSASVPHARTPRIGRSAHLAPPDGYGPLTRG